MKIKHVVPCCHMGSTQGMLIIDAIAVVGDNIHTPGIKLAILDHRMLLD